MKVLRRAANETVQALGVNIPTALMAVIGVGIKIMAVDPLYAKHVDSVSGSTLWLSESVAWLTTVLVVSVPLSVWNIQRVFKRERTLALHRTIAAESAITVDNQMKSFVRNTLINPSYGVIRCYAFGSIVRYDPTRDVDIIVQFDSANPKRARICRDRLRDVETSFFEFYNLKLHVQTFLSVENEALDRFLNTADSHERLI